MPYVIVGTAGLLAILVGAAMGLAGLALGGWIVGGTGGALTAIGVIGFGLQQRRDRDSSSRQLAEEEAAERLARRRHKEERERTAVEERDRIEKLRLARLRDIDRTRQAIIAELRKLQPGVSLRFQWGRTEDTLEWREYALFEDRGLFYVLMRHGGEQHRYVWLAGNIPSPNADDVRAWSAEDPDDVEVAFNLLQPERYLVAVNLPPEEQLELPGPGYSRHGLRDEKAGP